MADQTPSTCQVCHMAGDHKLSCPERQDGQLRFSTNLLPRTPSMPPLPYPAAFCDPFEPRNESAFAWPGSDRRKRHKEPLYTAEQVQAVADELVREALERAAQLCDDESSVEGIAQRCRDAIRALIPTLSLERSDQSP